MLTRNVIEYQEGMSYTPGTGVLCAGGCSKSAGVIGTPSPDEPAGKVTTISISVASSALELETELEVALGIQAGYGFFKSKAHADFSQKIKINEYSLWILVVARTTFIPTDYAFSGLKPDALATLSAVSDIAIGDDVVTCSEGSVQRRFLADTVILATGARGDLTLAEMLEAAGHRVIAIGDCRGVGYIEGAMRGAAEVARTLS